MAATRRPFSGGPWQENPNTIVSSRTPFWHINAHTAVTSSGLTDQLTDLTGNARHATQTSTARPTYEAAGGPFRKPCVTGNGTSTWMSIAWNPPAPGTTNIYVWFIARLNSWISGGTLFGGNSTNLNLIRGTGSSPNVGIRNATVVGSLAMTPGTWFRGFVSLLGGSTDSFRIGSNSATGLNSGNSDSTGFALFANFSGGSLGNYSLCEAIAWPGAPTGDEFTLLDLYVAHEYANNVTL